MQNPCRDAKFRVSTFIIGDVYWAARRCLRRATPTLLHHYISRLGRDADFYLHDLVSGQCFLTFTADAKMSIQQNCNKSKFIPLNLHFSA